MHGVSGVPILAPRREFRQDSEERAEHTRSFPVVQRPYQSNRNVVYSCKYHVVRCPKYRRQILLPPIDQTLKQVFRKVCDRTRSEILEMEVMPDPVHWLVACDPQFGIHRFIQSVKGNTSLLLRSAFPMRKRRLPSL
jgi:putative transposase